MKAAKTPSEFISQRANTAHEEKAKGRKSGFEAPSP
jgi:hypothetical protein